MSAILREPGIADADSLVGQSGQFDTEVDSEVRYSRANTRGFPIEAEVIGLVPKVPG